MKLLLTILLVVLFLPLVVLVGIAAGPAALVILFLAGCVLLVWGIVWLFQGPRAGRLG